MKVLFLTKYTRKGASSRLRTYQYLDYFRAEGIACDVKPFFDDAYLDEVYRSKKHNKWCAFKAFIRRVRVLTGIKRYDRVVLEKELFPYFPAVFERLLNLFGVKYIVDYDDAIFHNYDLSTNFLIRTFLRSKIPTVMRKAELVVAGNDYLRNKAVSFGAKEVVVIPTVIDLDKYPVKDEGRSDTFTIGWIGSPITFKYLSLLKPVFSSLQKQFDFRILYIGSGNTLGLPNETAVAWSEEGEVSNMQNFDVGIMPLEDNIWERGKCGYKLIQYMGCGIPVVGSPIGVNDEIITDGINGYKAETAEEWEGALEKLMTNSAEANRRIGMKGRAIVEHRYSLQVYRPVWLNLLLK